MREIIDLLIEKGIYVYHHHDQPSVNNYWSLCDLRVNLRGLFLPLYLRNKTLFYRSNKIWVQVWVHMN